MRSIFGIKISKKKLNNTTTDRKRKHLKDIYYKFCCIEYYIHTKSTRNDTQMKHMMNYRKFDIQATFETFF